MSGLFGGMLVEDGMGTIAGGVTLVSVLVTPANPSVALGLQQQFVATANFSDSTTLVVTATATWASTDVTKATVSDTPGTKGLATTVAQGSASITATYLGITGSTTLTVAAPTLLSIAVTPQDPVLYSGDTQQFVATGTYTDGSTPNITTLVAWSTSNANAFTIGASTGLATGTGMAVAATVTATLAPATPATSTVTCGAGWYTQSAGVGTAPLATTFARASSGFSVRTGTNTANTAAVGSNDVPRIGRADDANNLAFVFEETRTNTVKDNLDITTGNWIAGTGITATRPSGTAPDGSTTTPTRLVGTGFSAYQQFVNDSVTYQLSMWTQVTSGGAASARSQFGTANTDYTASVAWTRNPNVQYASVATNYFAPCNVFVGGQDVRYWGGQREAGGFSTEMIITGSSAVTRAGEQWSSTANLTSGGQLRMYFAGRPKGSVSQYSADEYLWYIDASNYARISSSTGAVTIAVAGTTYTTAVAASWAVNNYIEWMVCAGGSIASSVSYRVGGSGSWTTLSTGSPTAFGNITQAGSIDLLCKGTTNQFTGRWEKIAAYRAGFTPVV